MDVRLKRAYWPASPEDGWRVLVDRLWPRGLTKAEAAIDDWRSDLAPSPALRRWFGHDPRRWIEFRRRYEEELREKQAALAGLAVIARQRRLTLVYAARDEDHNHALALRDALVRGAGG